MVTEMMMERYLRALLEGDRARCRAVVEEILQSGTPANQVYADLIWPIMIEIEKLVRADRINSAQESMATRINRTIVDQLQNKLPRKTCREKTIVIVSAPRESSELGAQMTADLFESDGWNVRFLGGGVNNDDILAFVHNERPQVLLIYGTEPRCAPDVRHLIDTIRSVNAFPLMQIMLSGGVFNRADGLWQEIGADLFAATAAEAVHVASGDADTEIVKPKRMINRRKKRRQEPQITTE
ncbi:MAG: B12-binding domain-containing protein [Planctomycetota bacterium]